MIEIDQLIELGYVVKTELIKGSFDLKHNDETTNPKLINLKDGIVQTIEPFGGKQLSFRDIDELKTHMNS